MPRRSALRIRTSPLHILPVLAAFLTLAAVVQPAVAGNDKYSALVIDVNTGRTLFADDPDARRYPASLTKMMTLYVLFEDLDARKLTLDSRLSVSANAARQPPSKLGLKAGASIRVEDAILALVTKSANDIAVVVAEGVGGSVPAFATRMNRTARAIGMTRTRFDNPNGLPDDDQVTTARDLALLAQALQDRFPTYYKYFATRTFTYRGVRHRNHNRLLGSVEGVDGIKTGYTRASGFNLVTSVHRGNRRIIAVVMGGRSAASRDAHMRDLIATYLPKASKNGRTAPPVIADASADTGVDDPSVRLPRSRPDESGDSALLGYASPEAEPDVVTAALTEADAPQGDVSDADDDADEIADETDEPLDAATDTAADTAEQDPIAMRIASATAVAAFADIEVAETRSDPINRLTELARVRAGTDDVVAGPGRANDASGIGDDEGGWHIQIGAVPTAEGAEALIARAKQSLGPVLASLQPLTQEVDRNGTTLYRARFAGFADKDAARATCLQLKRKDFSCLAVPN